VTKETKLCITRFHANNYIARLSGLDFPLQFRRLLAITDVLIRARIDLVLFNGGQSCAVSTVC